MRLQTSVSRRVGNKEYFKNQVVIRNRTISQLGWCPGDYIEERIRGKGLLLFKIEPPQKPSRAGYDQFKIAVVRTLVSAPKGCCWPELRVKAGLEQVTPSPIWVRQLEEETGLERVRDNTASRVIWRLPVERLASLMSTLNGWTQNPQEQQMPDKGGERAEKHHG